MSAEPINDQDQRRRLTKSKKAPPPPQSTPSTGTQEDSGDHRLRRAPSAPIRNRFSAHAAAPTQHIRSPTLDSTSISHAAVARQQQYHPRLSVTERSSFDLLGSRFDSAAVINSFNAVPYSADPLPAQPRAAPPPIPQQHPTTFPPRPASLSHANTTGHNPAPELAQSFAATTGRKMEEIPGARQRYSDEVKETKVLKKKSGFSSFFNLSSPRRPAISAPENPVHVTHVGYDQETGEFTVSLTICVQASSAWPCDSGDIESVRRC